MDFPTISVMVNDRCNLSCPHCDLPRRYARYRADELSIANWTELTSLIISRCNPKTVSIAAMEPLLPSEFGQARTAAVLAESSRRGVECGLVTNGVYAADYFHRYSTVHCDFMDISVDGPPEVDARVRGQDHPVIVENLLSGTEIYDRAKTVFVSSTLTKWTAEPKQLGLFLDWIRRMMPEPRLVLLLLYPNANVQNGLQLDDEDLLSILPLLSRASTDFADIFLEVFPASVSGLAELINQGILPGEEETVLDSRGLRWGLVEDNLFIRYENKVDLARHHLRVSPQGDALAPECLERPDYRTGSYGSLVSNLEETLHQIEQDVNQRQRQLPLVCHDRPCAALCRGENHRCPILE